MAETDHDGGEEGRIRLNMHNTINIIQITQVNYIGNARWRKSR